VIPEIPPTFLVQRLCKAPHAATVAGSLPVLFFGDLFKASIATIGINPSRQEYLSSGGAELDGKQRRFETLQSLGANNRASLSPTHIATALDRMRGYFNADRPVYSWFTGLDRVVGGLGFSFQDRSAAHLDLVQESTDPVWSGLAAADPVQATTLLRNDLPFLRQQIEHFPLNAVICTSARVMREVTAMFDVNVIATGILARVKWTVGLAEIGRRVVGVAGWNIPLARPTGLDRDGQRALGEILASHLEKAGVTIRR
jgi:hypothetical protein